MTGPLGALERSLRDGPPDESGYRPQALEIATGLVGDEVTRIAPLDRSVSVRSVRRPSAASRRQYLALAIVVAVGLSVFGVMKSLPGVGGPSATNAPRLTETFVSTRNGFSVRYPAGWTTRPATISWAPDTFLPLASPAFDQLSRQGEARLSVASQALRTGEAEDERLAAGGLAGCGGGPSTWPRIPIDGVSGYLTGAYCPSTPDKGKISERDIYFDAVVFAGGRVYQISFDGDVDKGYFEAVLATLRLDPSQAID
jgi:hypothetical protein